MKSLRSIKQQVDVCMGQVGTYIGSLIYEKQGSRENAKFTYMPEWLANLDCFNLQPTEDVRQLWRRMVFNLLITNIDNHLQNLGFLHLNREKWKLAPAFNLNPFPDKDRESKTWLSEDMGPIVDLTQLIENCDYFSLTRSKALEVLGEVYQAVVNWKAVALDETVGLQSKELDDFAPAFEHEQMEKARELLQS